ncbi:MAG: hypothetical protein ABSC41_07950, partial [Acidimicrobiales bacterium]
STADTSTTQVTIAAQETLALSGGNGFDEGITTSLAYGGGAAVDGGVDCPGTASLTCLTTGDGTTTSSVAWGGTSSWTSTNLGSVTHLNQVACTSASSPTCVGVGYKRSSSTNSGAIVTTASDFGSASTDTVPSGVADISQVVCPSANGCYALATSTTGSPELLAGAVGQQSPLQDKWTVLTPTSGSTSIALNGLASIACPTSSTCELTGSGAVGILPSSPIVLRLDGDPAGLATNTAWKPTFTSDIIPITMKAVGEIVCPASSQCLALGSGDLLSPTDPTIFTAPISATSGQASTWINDAFPAGAASVTGISCTSTTCVAIGTEPGTPAPTAAVWPGSLAGNGSSDQWYLASDIPSIQAVTAVACGQPAGNDVADCEVAAVTGPGASELIDGSLAQNGGWVWNPSAGTTGAEYYSGLACESPPSSSQSTCAAAGVTASGPIIVTTASGPAGTWRTQTPSLPGAMVNGVPVETTPASQSNWTTNVSYSQSATGNATTLPGDLYPYANGYSIAAGDCATEANNTGASTSLSAIPGNQADATVPLGLVPLQVLNSSGVPLSGATATLTASTSGCAADTYTLPLTDADGITRIAVPYGTYSFTATAGSTTVPTSNSSVTVTVGASSVLVSTATTTSGTTTTTSTTTYLPNPAPVL